MDGNCLDLIRLQPMSLQHRIRYKVYPSQLRVKTAISATMPSHTHRPLTQLSQQPVTPKIMCWVWPPSQDVSDHYGLLVITCFLCLLFLLVLFVRLVFGTRPKLELSVWQRYLKPFGVPNFWVVPKLEDFFGWPWLRDLVGPVGMAPSNRGKWKV